MLTRWPLPDLAVLERRRPRPFDPHRALTELHRYGIEFVVIGGLAEVLHGAPYDTDDLDILVAPGSRDACAAMLRMLDARAVAATDDDPGLGLDWSASHLEAVDRLPLVTDAGRLDIISPEVVEPVSTVGMRLGQLDVSVADLDWLIAAKDASTSRVQRRRVPTLLALRDELQG